jgi:hypothetical protein
MTEFHTIFLWSDNAPTFRGGIWSNAVHNVASTHPKIRFVVQAFLAPHHAKGPCDTFFSLLVRHLGTEKRKGDIVTFDQLLSVLRMWTTTPSQGGSPSQNSFLAYSRSSGTLSLVDLKAEHTSLYLSLYMTRSRELVAARYFEANPTRYTHRCATHPSIVAVEVKASESPQRCRTSAKSTPPFSSRMLQHYRQTKELCE